MQDGVATCEIIYPVLCSLYANDMLTPSRHVELVFYADGTAIIAKPPASASYQLPGVISHPSRAVAERIEDRHHHVEEHSNAVCSGR